ncbi:hypothetical protein GGI20_003464 [Coemansia sp. BCRC 34301]|nr:hypothetical protein GGI20_003464 [Coemansia sp. BCRC 34301]
MDDVTVPATTTDGGLDDFGLIDYESPGPDPLLQPPDIEEPNIGEPEETDEHGSAANVLIDFEESEADDDDDEPDMSACAGGAEDSRMDLDNGADAGQLEQSLHDSNPLPEYDQLDNSPLVPAADELDDVHFYDDALVDEIVGKHNAEDADEIVSELDAEVAAHTVPETWVFSDGEWMIYLGPNQHSYGADYQATLFAMPLDQLISALHSDISLREDTELALEFPSLALTIDQRDRECADTSLAQIYNCHAAAVRLGRLSEDLVNSPYFAHSTLADAASLYSPLPDSFAFIIHSRPSVHSSFKRIMQIVADDAQANNSQPEPPAVPQVDEPKEAVTEDTVDKAPVNDIAAEGVGQEEDVADKPSATTADLLADAGDDDEEEEDDEDYVAEGEEEGDFVLEEEGDDDDDDAGEEEEQEADGDEEEEEEDVEAAEHGEDDIDGIETRVESLSTSPTHKRSQDSVTELDDEVVPDCDKPAAKKPRSDDATVQGNEKAATQL